MTDPAAPARRRRPMPLPSQWPVVLIGLALLLAGVLWLGAGGWRFGAGRPFLAASFRRRIHWPLMTFSADA